MQNYRTHTCGELRSTDINKDVKLVQEGGKLADIAPTIIDLLGEKKPAEMTGESLIIHE